MRLYLRCFVKLCRFALLPAITLLATGPYARADTTWADKACQAGQYDETVHIKYIHDGDTLHLKDGRKVRLIGINTPEVAHGEKTAEPFSYEAKKALSALFKNNKTIALVYGRDKQDRYKRLLAHAFTRDGNNVQASLLAQGLARTITFPPNTQFSACYLQQERKARCAKIGLWNNSTPLPTNKLGNTHAGFQLVTGKLKNITINNRGIWLNLDDKLTVGIRPDNRQLFDINELNKMLKQKIIVRGWLNKSKKETPFYIRIRHPSSIQPAAAFACKPQVSYLTP